MEGVAKPAFWTPKFEVDRLPDGTILMGQHGGIDPHWSTVPQMLRHWAKAVPDKPWMCQRGADDAWVCTTYSQALAAVRALATAFREMLPDPGRPVLILSENSTEHALVALAAQYAGAASAAVSTAYSLLSSDHAKLRDIVDTLQPGLVFAQDGDAYGRALAAVGLPSSRIIVAVNAVTPGTHLLSDLMATAVDAETDRAAAAISAADTAKYLFTSGSTGSPKAVINTHGMILNNQAMVADCFRFLEDHPPVMVDWAPWSHTASGNKVFHMVLYHGGTYYIDAGKPTPKLIGETVRNLKDVAPTWYFNVPAGYEMLVNAFRQDRGVRDRFFSRLDMMMYAGAGMAQHLWDELLTLARESTGHPVLLATGLGSTETGPFAIMCTEQQATAGNVGVPAKGVTLKLVPNGGKLEARLKSPSITPGYLGAAEATADAFDAEGFFKLGDALRPAEPDDLTKGFLFDGRIAENFKLATGTWVAVGPLRAAMVDHFGGLLRDVVIVGEDREELGALAFPVPERISDLGDTAREVLTELLRSFAKAATGSATRVRRLMVLDTPPDLDKGEVTDKGSINQRAVIRNRAEATAHLFSDAPEIIRV